MRLKESKKINEVVDFFTLAGGTILAQLVAIFFSPILSRIYSTEEMGLYTLVITITGIFESVICLRYDLLIVSTEDKAVSTAKTVCIKLAIILSAVITLVYILYQALYVGVGYEKCLLFSLNFILLVVHGFVLTATAQNNRAKNYKLISGSSLSLSSAQYCTSSLMGLIGFGTWGLIIGRVLGAIIGFLTAIKFNIVGFFKIKFDPENTETEKSFILDNKKQALFSTPAVLLYSLSYSMINFFISDLFGDATLGLYGYSYRLLGLPLTIVSTNINRMFFRNASIEYKETGTMKKSMLKVLLPLLLIAVVMVVGFSLFAPDVFSWYLGEKWREAGVYVQILAPMFGVRLVSNSFTNATIVVGKQFLSLILQGTYLVATIALYAVYKFMGTDIRSFLTTMNYLFCVVYGVYFIVLMRMCLSKNRCQEDRL